jgi:hypothetical protein
VVASLHCPPPFHWARSLYLGFAITKQGVTGGALGNKFGDGSGGCLVVWGK